MTKIQALIHLNKTGAILRTDFLCLRQLIEEAAAKNFDFIIISWKVVSWSEYLTPIESARPVEAKQGKITDEQLCERCGLYRRYQHPKIGKIFKLCASCGWEALTELCDFSEDDKKEEIKNDKNTMDR